MTAALILMDAAVVVVGLVLTARPADRVRPVRHARRVRYVPGARPPVPLPEVEEWEL